MRATPGPGLSAGEPLPPTAEAAVAAAAEARLRSTSDQLPGYRRQRQGRGFTYELAGAWGGVRQGRRMSRPERLVLALLGGG